jgi:hypothetical protein
MSKKSDPKRVMQLIDKKKGLMKCRVCGFTHMADLRPNGKGYPPESWHCMNGCTVPVKSPKETTASE